MREECKHYQSRTYADGEVARFCELDLAPDAPWRCPDNCPSYERRLADAGWTHGSLVEPPTPEEPALFDGAAELLNDAEDIVNSVAPEVVAEEERLRDRADSAGTWWKRLRPAFRRRPRA